ncbi:MAG: hypothetical protein ABIL58_18225 [Pseudomonadota bacterium]
MDILSFSRKASDAWNSLPQEMKSSLDKYFHLRPTNSGITIVSTIPFFPMRGIAGIRSKDSLLDKLNDIYKNMNQISSVDIEVVTEKMKEIGFTKREGKKAVNIEEDIQALMIRSMSNDENLRIKLSAANRIKFVASELIFEKGKNRVDVVGFDGINLYLFELKKGRTTKVDQVRRYVDYYSESKNLIRLKELLKFYPINPVDRFDGIKGIMVMQYADNSTKNWPYLAEINDIDILFFEKSISYR